MFTPRPAATRPAALTLIAFWVGVYACHRWRRPDRAARPSGDGRPAGSDNAFPLVAADPNVLPMIPRPRWIVPEEFTAAGRHVVARAHMQAYAHHSDYVGTEHLLLALIIDHPEVVADALAGTHIALAQLRGQIEAHIGPEQTPRPAHLPYSAHAKRALAPSPQEARQGPLVDVLDIVLGVLAQPESAAARSIMELGVDPASIVHRPLRQSSPLEGQYHVV